jgi:hypothetical protein
MDADRAWQGIRTVVAWVMTADTTGAAIGGYPRLEEEFFAQFYARC